jgi:hypothetical protein
LKVKGRGKNEEQERVRGRGRQFMKGMGCEQKDGYTLHFWPFLLISLGKGIGLK